MKAYIKIGLISLKNGGPFATHIGSLALVDFLIGNMKHFKWQTKKTYMNSEMISSDFGRSAQRFSHQRIIFLQKNVTEKCATYLEEIYDLL